MMTCILNNPKAAALGSALAAGEAPEDVAAMIVAAAQDRAPRLRYPSVKVAKQTSFARVVFDRSLRKQFSFA